MGIGDISKGTIVSRRDPLTGVEVRKLTGDEGNTIHPYFTQPLFSGDGRYLLTASDRTGSWQLYTLEIRTGDMVQLTDDREVGFQSAQLDGTNFIAYYWSGSVLKSVDCQTLKGDEYYRVPEGFLPGSLSMTSDGRFIDFCYSEKLALSTYTGKLYSDMKETFFRRPSSLVMRLGVGDKSAQPLWGERRWISHIITNPADNRFVVYNHEGPWHLLQRTWVINADTLENYPIVETKTHFERAGHEFFTRKGNIVTQYGYRTSPADKYWKCADLFIKPDGTGERRYEYKPGAKSMHVQVNSRETLGIADGYFVPGGPEDGNNYMSLVRYEEGLAKQEMLCVHGTSWKTQHSHPHPVFTPDDKYVIFGSDMGGKSNVYMAPAGQ